MNQNIESVLLHTYLDESYSVKAYTCGMFIGLKRSYMFHIRLFVVSALAGVSGAPLLFDDPKFDPRVRD